MTSSESAWNSRLCEMHKAPKGTNSTNKVGGTTGPQGRRTFLKNMFFEILPVFVCFFGNFWEGLLVL